MAYGSAARKTPPPHASPNGNGKRRSRPQARPLDAFVGHLYTPVWAMRPGAYTALQDLADCMPLWLAIYSRNGDHMAPCWASKETLATTIGVSRATVTRQLDRLRKSGLLWELEHGPDPKAGSYRPPSRWALDPFAKCKYWRDVVPKRLPEIAEQHGHGALWLRRAQHAFEAQVNRSDRIRALIARDMPVKPSDDRPKKAPRLRERRAPKGRDTVKYMRRFTKELFRENLPPAHSEPPDVCYTRRVVAAPKKSSSNGRSKKNGRANPGDVVLKKGPPTNGDGVVLTRALPDSVGERADSTGMVPELRAGSEMLCKPSVHQGEFEVRSREAAEDTMRNTGESQTSLDLPRSPLPYQDPGDSR